MCLSLCLLVLLLRSLLELPLDLQHRFDPRQLARQIDVMTLRPPLQSPLAHEDARLCTHIRQGLGLGKNQMTHLLVPLASVLLPERLMLDGLQHVIQHQVDGGQQRALLVP